MGAAGQLKNLYQQILGGTAPSGTASASGDISQMIKYIAAGSSTQSFYPLLGFTPPYVTGESDATISVNTTISGSSGSVKRYKDLTINSGIVLTCEVTPQIIVCRNLSFGNTSAEIRAAYNTTQPSTEGLGGYAGSWYYDQATAAINTASIMMPHFAAGGAGANAAATPAAATNGSAYSYNAALLLLAILNGAPINGGGNGGNNSATKGAGGNGGTYGFAGANAGASGSGGGGGGGGGIGGGGGAGGTDTDQAGSLTQKTGGRGGGIVLVIVTGDISTAAGLITANGENGAASATGTNKGGGSGAGGGGFAALIAKSSTVVPTLQANGGTGGTAGNGGSAGGNGGNGATIRVVG